MRAIMLMFDSLNRHMLSTYGCDWTITPNFKRLAEKTVTFDNCYVGSMPCMPARRELHTGRYNFLHRSWGPIEPYDDSMVELLNDSGIYTHMITDHQHYWEDGGATYHNRYNSYELVRGQEGDKWKGEAHDPDKPVGGAYQKQLLTRGDAINRKYMRCEEEQPLSRVFEYSFEFLNANANADRWFLQIECFDPHEPFMTFEKYKNLYPGTKGDSNDWPDYGPVKDSEEEIKNMRHQYAALLSMCDEYLGRLLDYMDEHDMWKDTMLIVNTDHGFLLSEHDCWGKIVMPFFNEVARTPLFIWDPRFKKCGENRSSLVQMIDMAPTLLDFFGIDIPKDMLGKSLDEVIENDCKIRDAVLYGIYGGHVNCTDGRYVYMRGVHTDDNKPLYQYTLMPTHMRKRFSIDELSNAEFSKPFSFTKGLRLMKIEAGVWDKRDSFSMSGMLTPSHLHEDMLFDLEKDPGMVNPIRNPEIEEYMKQIMIRLMKENDAPEEQYARLGLV